MIFHALCYGGKTNDNDCNNSTHHYDYRITGTAENVKKKLSL